MEQPTDHALPPTTPPVPPTPHSVAPPHLRDYRLEEPIGAGGMGTVYRAVHVRLGRAFALKLLPASATGNPELVKRFEREMKAVGKLDHPHLVRATDAGEDGGTHFLVMELVEGSDLGALVRRRGVLGIADACEAARQAALGLAHAHAAGLIHRDIKPSNLMLGRDGRVRVLDLGLALLQEALAGGDAVTPVGAVLGTYDYLAPEQADAPHTVDGRADVYSLGWTAGNSGRAWIGTAGAQSIATISRVVKNCCLRWGATVNL